MPKVEIAATFPLSLREGARQFCRAAGAGGGYHPAALLDLLPALPEKADWPLCEEILDLAEAAEAMACHWGGPLGIFSRIESDWVRGEDGRWTLRPEAMATHGQWCLLGWETHHHVVGLWISSDYKAELVIGCTPDPDVQGLACTPQRCERVAALELGG